MAIYAFACPEGHTAEVFRKVERRNDPLNCPVCKAAMSRDLRAETVNAQNDFEHPVYSEGLGIHPSQISEAKRKFPHHDFTPDGRMVIRSTAERERIRKDLGFSG